MWINMEDKTTDVINNVCTILGAALLLKPIIDEAAKTLVPEIQKLTTGDVKEELKMLSAEQEKRPEDKKEISEPHEQPSPQPTQHEKPYHTEREYDDC